MHKEIISQEQKNILPLLEKFKTEFYLAGGTAIALQIGHRKSIDFDLFTNHEIKIRILENQIKRSGFQIEQVFTSNIDEFTVVINKVKVSFVSFPFFINSNEKLDNVINLPNLLTLAAMKAYALGRRSKWKDYVDLYFILRDFFSINIISHEASKIFGGSFNSRCFREQLIWFKDIDYSEKVEFLEGKKVDNGEIKNFFKKILKS